MKKLLKWVGIVLVVLFIIGIIAGKDKSTDSEVSEAVKLTEQKIAITDNGYKAIELLIDDDISTSLSGNHSGIDTGYTVVSARELQDVYSKNQARGDKNYKDKKIIITGVVESINSSIGDTPVVNLKTGEMFNHVMVFFTRSNQGIAADLDKNQKVTFACIGDGVVMGSPSLKNCRPVDDVKTEIFNSEMKLVNKFVKGDNNVPEFIKMVVITSVLLTEKTNDFSQCKVIDLACLEDSIKNKKISSEELISKAKELNIDLPK